MEFETLKSLLTWFHELPYPKTSYQVNFNDIGAIFNINDASFKFLETVARVLEDLKHTVDGILKSSHRKVHFIAHYVSE